MGFLPDGYKEPVNSKYMNFELGSNVFRVLGSAKIGYEYWIESTIDGVTKPRPVRSEFED